MAITTKIYESIPERDGRKYVTYEFTSEYGDTKKIGPVLEQADTDTVARASQLEGTFLAELQHKERKMAMNLAIREGVNPANLVYRYHDKATILRHMYTEELEAEEATAIQRLNILQNASNRIRLFLGIL